LKKTLNGKPNQVLSIPMTLSCIFFSWLPVTITPLRKRMLTVEQYDDIPEMMTSLPSKQASYNASLCNVELNHVKITLESFS